MKTPRMRVSAALTCVATLAALAAGVTASDTKPASAPANSPAPGQQLYGRHCLSCHQADGGGVPNMQPPIKGGKWVQGDSRALALFVMTGGFDSGSRKDSDNGNVMPPFRQLPDAELAQILSYIRAKFGNGGTPVTAAQVAQTRASLPPSQ
ncbi:MAG TPA: cytochrome c [Steroidobacteraceae bacterium]|nr:cytochrome c [Steroidobacteraceae bacterium]